MRWWAVDKDTGREEETRGIFGYHVSGRPIQYAGPIKPNVDQAETIRRSRRGWRRENVSRSHSVVDAQPLAGDANEASMQKAPLCCERKIISKPFTYMII